MTNHTNSACPTPQGSENFSNKGSAWKPMMLISLGCLGATTAISLSLIILHLRRYRAPKEQRQIIRIVFSVVIYSLVAFFEIFRYQYAQYVDPIGDVYEAFGLCALFLLFIQYAAPSGTFNDDTFDAVKSAADTETNFNWPKLAWVFVFQYPIIEILCVGVQEATEVTGHYCLNSLSPKFAHIWVELLESVSIGACVLAIWRFRGHMKGMMKVRRGLSKLACFKLIVFIRFVQQWIFSILLEKHYIKTSKTLSYNDILYGIPAVLTCAEMVLFSAGFWYAYSSTEYGSKAKPGRPLPLWQAVLHAINPWDILVGMARIFPLTVELKRSGDWAKWWASYRESGLQGLVRKSYRRFRGQKGGDRYQELNEGREPMARGTEMHNRPYSGAPDDDTLHYTMSGGLGPNEMYQPPAASPPKESPTYLSTEARGRQRAQSQSSLMEEAAPAYDGRPRAETGGAQNWDRYDRTPSPAAAHFTDQPTQGRDIV